MTYPVSPTAFAAHWKAALDRCRTPQEVRDMVEGHDAYMGDVTGPLTEDQRGLAKAREYGLGKPKRGVPA